MIDLSKAYSKAKKYVSKKEELNDFGFYYYIELEEVYAFLVGLNRDNSLFKKVITVNKTGGKVLEFSILKLNKQFNDFSIHNLIEIDDPDFLGEVFPDSSFKEDVREILDLDFKDEISRRDILFNLVETGESYRIVDKVYRSGITVDNILMMNLDDFAEAYGIRKKDLFKKIYLLGKQELSLNDISIYALYSRGVSIGFCNKLFELGIDKLYKLFLIPKEIFGTKYSMNEHSVEKIYEGLDKMEFELINDQRIIDYLDTLKNDDNYRKVVKSEIHKIISESEKEIKPLLLKNKLDNRYCQLPILNELINEMIKDKVISLNEFGLKANVIRLKDYLNYLPNNFYTDLARKYFLDNLSTYESLAEPLKITRERVRQILKKTPIPKVFEDSYESYFKKYDFSDKSFMYLFDEERYVYKYLLYKFDKKGDVKLEEMLEDDLIEDKLKRKVEELYQNKYLYIDGNKVYKSKTNLLQYYMKDNVRKLTPINDIWMGFKNFIIETIPNIDDLRFDSLDDVRAVEAPISMECFPSLKTNGRKYKYYDFKANEVKMLIDAMHLEQYVDIEISSKYLFELHKELMKEFDIDDEYVLHNLLRKVYKKDNVNYQRSPYIVFGNGDRIKQIDELILEHAPILTADLSKIYCEIYGGHLATVKAFIESIYKELINKQMISLEYSSVLPSEELNKFKLLLCSKEMWFKEDIYNICKNNNIDIPKNLFAWQNLEKIGFKNASNYIYSSNYSSMTEYLEINYFTKDFLDIKSIDRRITYIVLFSELLTEKRQNLDIIEYEKGKFMKTALLSKAGVDIVHLKNFIDTVDDFTINKGPFTIKSIKNEGYHHEIFDLGFEDIFYSSVLRGSEKFRFKRYGTVILFENTDKKKEVSVANLLEKILFSCRRIEEYDLAEYIEEMYGLDYRDNYFDLQSFAKKTNIYYDKYNDVYYYDYETYYEEM